MICPNCNTWIDSIVVYEKSWVRYDVYIDRGTKEAQWEEQEVVDNVDEREIVCPECFETISTNVDKIVKKLVNCDAKIYRKKCQTCDDKFKCWTA